MDRLPQHPMKSLDNALKPPPLTEDAEASEYSLPTRNTTCISADSSPASNWLALSDEDVATLRQGHGHCGIMRVALNVCNRLHARNILGLCLRPSASSNIRDSAKGDKTLSRSPCEAVVASTSTSGVTADMTSLDACSATEAEKNRSGEVTETPRQGHALAACPGLGLTVVTEANGRDQADYVSESATPTPLRPTQKNMHQGLRSVPYIQMPSSASCHNLGPSPFDASAPPSDTSGSAGNTPVGSVSTGSMEGLPIRSTFLWHRRKNSTSRKQRRQRVPIIKQSNFSIVVTGHSLGAGIAAFVAIWLRLVFPDTPVKAWLYGCPAGLMSKNVANIVGKWCCQLVIGKDLVARLSMGTFQRLRDEMMVVR
jgi:hypothetical protein